MRRARAPTTRPKTRNNKMLIGHSPRWASAVAASQPSRASADHGQTTWDPSSKDPANVVLRKQRVERRARDVQSRRFADMNAATTLGGGAEMVRTTAVAYRTLGAACSARAA